MIDWFFATLKQYPEIAIFLTLAIGYYFGKFTFKGIGLGSVTATLLAGVLIGQIGITITQPLKATVFLMFLFAVGYGVGPQFVRGVARDGVPQALFSAVQCVFSLLVPVGIAKLAGYDLGYAAGLYSGSQTISAAMGLSTDAINRLGLAADQAKALIDSMPIAYAVTYMFGTMGSAVVIAVLGPKLLGINLEAACKDYEQKQGGVKELGGPGSAWRRWEVRAFRVAPGGRAVGLRVVEAEALVPDARVFVQRIRRNGKIEEATADTVLQEGDVVAVAGARDVLVKVLGEQASRGRGSGAAGRAGGGRRRPRDQQGGRRQDAGRSGPDAGGARRLPAEDHARRHRNRHPHPADHHGPARRPAHASSAARRTPTRPSSCWASPIARPTSPTWHSSACVIMIGALFGSLVLNIGGVPLTLSTAGGALVAGIIGGWLRSVRPSFGRIPTPTIWFMNSVGLNIFIAIVGISAGPGFVNGLKTQGVGLFLWGAARHDAPAGARDVHRQVPVPLP